MAFLCSLILNLSTCYPPDIHLTFQCTMHQERYTQRNIWERTGKAPILRIKNMVPLRGTIFFY